MKIFAVGIVLSQEGKFLAEKRTNDEEYFPGAVQFPGGEIGKEETPEEGLVREIKEELNIDVEEYTFVGEYIHHDGAKNFTYLITKWSGKIKVLEAESVHWITQQSELTSELDKKMFQDARAILPDEGLKKI